MSSSGISSCPNPTSSSAQPETRDADGRRVGHLSAVAGTRETSSPTWRYSSGDTNTVMGCIAAAQLNIPIVHIEGLHALLRLADAGREIPDGDRPLSDVIYTYFDEYKEQGVREGINPRNIVVIQNLIVDVLNHYYFDRRDEYEEYASKEFFAERGLERDRFYLMTCHRRESVESPGAAAGDHGSDRQSPWPVYFPASYRTQKRLKEFSIELPPTTTMVDPIGYRELLALLGNSRGALTDSGTVVEETAVIGVPSLQIRKATERPQVYDCGSSVKFDPARPEDYPAAQLFAKLERLHGRPLTTDWVTATPLSGWWRIWSTGCRTRRCGAISRRTRISTCPAPIARTACRFHELRVGAVGVRRRLAFAGHRRAGLQRGSRYRTVPAGRSCGRCARYSGASIVIAVDDGSQRRDRGAALVDLERELDLTRRYVRHKVNAGYGAALRTGAHKRARAGVRHTWRSSTAT